MIDTKKYTMKGAVRAERIPFAHGLSCGDMTRLISFFEMMGELGAPKAVIDFCEPQIQMLNKAMQNCLDAWVKENFPECDGVAFGDISKQPPEIQQFYKDYINKTDN